MMAMFEKHRDRRVIYNDDADQQFLGYEGYGYAIDDEQSFIRARTTPTFDTQVDTYVWCVGNGCDPPWGGMDTIRPCLGSSDHAADLIVDACHAHGIEVWGSLRMNDIHDSFQADVLEKTNDPLKAQHPEYLIGQQSDRELPAELTERYLWTAFNFARPEVRRHRLDFIARNAAEHDFDGYELDFTRFVWDFPLGEERSHADEMTALVREARARLDAIGERRGRPYTFAVHVMDSPELSLRLGRDVEGWLTRGLVDVLVVGMGYMPYVLRLDQWLALGRQYGVPVYPSVNTNTFAPWFKRIFQQPAAWHEAIRAAAATYWQQGADGVCLFNLFCMEDTNVGPMPREAVYAPLREVGDPAALAGLDKLYGIQPVNESGFCHHGSGAAPLPVPLDRVERKLPLKIGPDAEDPGARFALSVLTTGVDADRRVRLRLNHTLLPDPAAEDPWYRVDVPAGVLQVGCNELSIWCDAALADVARPIIVQQVFVAVRYGGGQA